ncbi:hypothetical protein ACUOCP_26245, partial [Escherichia sp. R-CC3]
RAQVVLATNFAKLESLMTGPRKKRLFNGLMP